MPISAVYPRAARPTNCEVHSLPFPRKCTPFGRGLSLLQPCDSLAALHRLHRSKSPMRKTQRFKRLRRCTLDSDTNLYASCASQELCRSRVSWIAIRVLMRIGLDRLIWSICWRTCWPSHLQTIRPRSNKCYWVVCVRRSCTASPVRRTPLTYQRPGGKAR